MIAHGWRLVMRSAGSKGAADLAMVHPVHGLALVQVGTERSKTLGPTDRDRFVSLAEACSALPLVALAVPSVGFRFLLATRDKPATWEGWELS